MKLGKFIKSSSILLVIGALYGCADEPRAYGGSIVMQQPTEQQSIEFTQQPIEKANELHPGMTEQEVIDILGNPITVEFNRKLGIKVSQWCRTGGEPQTPYDRFLAAWFVNGELADIKNYTNRNELQQGDCKTLYREVDWTAIPAQVIEIRERKVAY